MDGIGASVNGTGIDDRVIAIPVVEMAQSGLPDFAASIRPVAVLVIFSVPLPFWLMAKLSPPPSAKIVPAFFDGEVVITRYGGAFKHRHARVDAAG